MSKVVFDIKAPSEDLSSKRQLGALLGLVRDVINTNLDDHTHFRITVDAIDGDENRRDDCPQCSEVQACSFHAK